MTSTWPGYEAQALHYGDNLAVVLRPTLRAAVALEAAFGGLRNLFAQVNGRHLGAMKAIIEHGAGPSFTLPSFEGASLSAFFEAAHGPVVAFCRGLLPPASSSPSNGKPTDAPTDWREVYMQLFSLSTGWLQWPPQTVWESTPTELAFALDAHTRKLTALHGGADDEESTSNEAQRQANEAAGLDPEFDREGLQALKRLMG